ncbi:MAG: hypothetical protein JW704_02510 [Anaerolineaceae bacterium]|nr:hypothetical protein [Anaerolineaceae bacterium]
MTVKRNIDGTTADRFEIGDGSNFGVRRDGVQLKLFDEDVGEYPLRDLVGGSSLWDRLILTRAGGLVYTPASTPGEIDFVVRE